MLKSFDPEADVIPVLPSPTVLSRRATASARRRRGGTLKTQALKFRTSVACPMVTQEVLAQFIVPMAATSTTCAPACAPR